MIVRYAYKNCFSLIILSENIDGTLNSLFVTLYWIRVRDRGSLGLEVRVRVLELSSVSSVLSVPKIGSQYFITYKFWKSTQ